ncbi:MAG: hypothetical protein WCM93_15050 [Bacteroidota bacterium]
MSHLKISLLKEPNHYARRLQYLYTTLKNENILPIFQRQSGRHATVNFGDGSASVNGIVNTDKMK